MITVASDHLWRSVARATTRRLQSSSLLIHVGEAKVDDLQLAIIVAEQVFWLEISMADAKLVNIVHTSDKLLEMLTCCNFLKFLIFDNQLKQFTSRSELHHEIQVLIRLNNLIDLDYIRMVKLFEDFDLSADSLYILFVFNF